MDDRIFTDQWTLLFVITALLLAVAEAGYRGGLRLFKTADVAHRRQIGGVQAAVLGLLGLLLGFTFAMAVGRYDTRRDLVLKEANAIGTTWLRAGLLPEEHCAPVKDLLRRYVETRLKYEALSRDAARLAEGLRLGAGLQNEMWQHAEGLATESPSLVTLAFIASLNALIDTDAERIAAGRNQIPVGVWVLVIFVAAFGCFTSSYGSGAYGVRSAFTNLLLPVLIAIVIAMIFDLSHSRQGIIGISQQPLIDLLNNIQPKPSP
jgi:hypothetical protein